MSFLSKAEKMKKSRGLEANIDQEEYERKASENAKHSLARVINSTDSFHEDL